MNIDNNDGIKNISIHFIESYPCNSKEELLEREKYYSKILNPECNTYSPIRTREQWNEYMRNFRKKNLEKIREYERELSKKNIEKRREQNKKSKEKNIERIREKRREKNKEKILCMYGMEICRGSKSGHEKTKYHLQNINNENLNL